MPVEILMPALSPTMEKGNLAKWVKQEGDTVKSGDVIAEIETDKATMEVEAVDEGVIAKILVPEGAQDVPVNQIIAVLAVEGEDAKSVAAAAGQGGAPAAAPTAPAPVAAAAAAAPATVAASSATPAVAAPAGGRVFASPLARRIAKEKGIELSTLKGSGPHGRIVARDVDAARVVATASAPASAAPAAAPKDAPKAAVASAPGAEQVKAQYEAGTYEEIQLDGMRKTIARRLVESEQVTPTFFLTVDCTLDDLMALREQVNANAVLNKDGKPSYRVSVNDFIIKALALALQAVPAANSVWAEDRVLRMKHSDVGVAVAIDGGLYAPVVKKAEQKTLSAISNEMRDLATRARNKKLKPEEYSGGSTSVSNLGMMGVRNFTAIINAPQSSIFAIGASEKRVVADGNEMKIATQMTVTMTCDHRVMDGALGAELLAAFKGFIEKPMSMLV